MKEVLKLQPGQNTGSTGGKIMSLPRFSAAHAESAPMGMEVPQRGPGAESGEQ